jgi:hypothetical protein
MVDRPDQFLYKATLKEGNLQGLKRLNLEGYYKRLAPRHEMQELENLTPAFQSMPAIY